MAPDSPRLPVPLQLAPRDVLASLAQAFPKAEPRDLARFAIACGGDLSRAQQRFKQHLQWRQDVLPSVVRHASPTPLLRGACVAPVGRLSHWPSSPAHPQVKGTPTLDLSQLEQSADAALIDEFSTGKMVRMTADRHLEGAHAVYTPVIDSDLTGRGVVPGDPWARS